MFRARNNRSKTDLSAFPGPLLSQASTALGMKLRWPLGDPFEKRCQMRMCAKRFGRVVITCQLGLCQGCVDLIVADLVDQNRWSAFATFQLWDQMMMALPDTRRNGAFAKWADRVDVIHANFPKARPLCAGVAAGIKLSQWDQNSRDLRWTST